MTKKQLKALECLPDVVDALLSLVKDAGRLREAMARAGELGVLPSTHNRLPPDAVVPTFVPGLPPTPPPATMLDTPERREYLADLEAKRTASKAPPAPAMDARQQELLEVLRKDPRRQALLQQFPHDGDEVQQ